MSKFVVNGDMFGKYAEIPTGFSKEMHIYKIVSVFESNSYCDIPLCTVNTKETLHQQIETVLNVIHCGIDESEVVRVALKDCQIINNQPQVQPIDADYIIKQIEEQTSFLKDCTKYGNKDSEQQHKSYSTMMVYEVADLVDDLIEIIRQSGKKVP